MVQHRNKSFIQSEAQHNLHVVSGRVVSRPLIIPNVIYKPVFSINVVVWHVWFVDLSTSPAACLLSTDAAAGATTNKTL